MTDDRLCPESAETPGANGIKLRGSWAWVSVTDRNLILRPPVREDGAAGPLEVAAENCARTTSSAEWSVASKWTRRNPTMDVRQERPKADFGKPVSAHSRLSAKRTANTGRRFPSPGCCAATPSPLGRWFFLRPTAG